MMFTVKLSHTSPPSTDCNVIVVLAGQGGAVSVADQMFIIDVTPCDCKTVMPSNARTSKLLEAAAVLPAMPMLDVGA